MVTSDGGKPKQNKRRGVPFSNRWPLSEGCRVADAATQEAIPAEGQLWQRPYAGKAGGDVDRRKYHFSAEVEKDLGGQS